MPKAINKWKKGVGFERNWRAVKPSQLCSIFSVEKNLGWCQKTYTITDDYIQVDMGAIRAVCVVATQGKKDGSFVKSYKLSFSVD